MPQQQQPQPDPILHECWLAVQTNLSQHYINEDLTVQWFNRVIAQKHLDNQMVDINVREKLYVYMKDVHDLDRESVQNVQFTFQEAVGFYQWVVGGERDGQPQLGEDQDNINNADNEDVEQKDHHQQSPNNKTPENNSKIKQTPKQHKTPIHKHPTQPKQPTQPQQPYLYPQNPTTQQPQQNQFAQTPHTQDNDPKNTQNTIAKNYTQYLNTIFEHYCRMSYATGNDPTFEQIQQKTQVMTINKFMIFCKEFGIVKLNDMSRQNLVEIFKKNSEFYKEMSFQQFMAVLVKISFLVYSPEFQGEQSQNSKEFQQLLLFLEVNNFAAFKKKIQALNISYRARASNQGNQQKKILPSNYKFKFSAAGGKSQQQVKQQIQQRKKIRSQNKLKIIQKKHQKSRNISSKKDLIKLEHQQRDLQRNQIKTSQPTKKLAPPLPPPRRPSNTTNNKTPTQQPPVITGYANIHKLKLLGKQGNIQSKMKLNSIVQQAKKLVQLNNSTNQQYTQQPISNRISTHGRQTPYSNYTQHRNYISDRDLADSQQSNYSQRDLHVLDQYPYPRNYGNKNYVAHGHSQLEKRVLTKQNHEDLEGIINNQSDQDQYLEEHLNREKKTGVMNQRIQKKIKEYQLKSGHK